VTTTTTDRRELVARAILRRESLAYTDDEFEVFWNEGMTPVRHAYRQADAVLAALEPWLLPDIPEWVKDITAVTSVDRWDVIVKAKVPSDDRFSLNYDTPASAIRAALEDQS
jgi:hypothetical protein